MLAMLRRVRLPGDDVDVPTAEPPFDDAVLHRICDVLGDTHMGLSNKEIDELLAAARIPDPTPRDSLIVIVASSVSHVGHGSEGTGVRTRVNHCETGRGLVAWFGGRAGASSPR
jgi:hypothetical protein